MEAAVFVVCAVIVLGGALGVILSHNTVHAALSLVATLFAVAVLFIAQDAQFLAAVQVIVYAGAIVVLFVFVIMLLGVDEVEDLAVEPLAGQRPAAVVVGLVALGLSLVVLLAAGSTVTGQAATDAAISTDVPNITQIGRLLFTDWVFAFEATSILLTVAVVGAWSWPVARPVRTTSSRARPARVHVPTTRPRSARSADVLAVVVTDTWYLMLSAALFTMGGVGLLVRRNPLVMFMCVELMLNAVNLTFVSFARAYNDLNGQIVVLFVMVVAAAEVVVGLAIVVSVLRRRPGATADDVHMLRG